MKLRSAVGESTFPWYRSHARTALVAASGLFVAVTVAHIFANRTGQAVDILYALPVALVAMAFGLRGGLIGAASGFSLFAAVELTYGVGDIDVTGWLARAAGLFLLGILLGYATDQIESGQRAAMAAQRERLALTARARRHAEALEISDSILQHLVVAKWMVEAGQYDKALEIMTTTIATGERMVADVLPERRHGAEPLPPTIDSVMQE
jgi:hypothetical protein